MRSSVTACNIPATGVPNGALAIYQDATLYLAALDAGRAVTHAIAPGRRAYVFVAQGAVTVNGQQVGPSDAAAIEGESSLELKATVPSELLLIDLP
jgi:redox-sensitive bicupin YhaK (pirin superfamily)